MKRSEQKLRTKKQIKDAFFILLDKKTLEQITVTEIAELANIDRKTFYLHYNTVYDIYKDIEQDIASSLKVVLSSNEELDSLDFLHKLSEIMKRDLKFYKIAAKRADYSFLVDECTTILAKELTDSIKCNDEDEFTIEMRARYVSAGLIRIYIEWLNFGTDEDLEKYINVMAKLMENTIKQ